MKKQETDYELIDLITPVGRFRIWKKQNIFWK